MTPLPKRRWSTRRQGKKRVIMRASLEQRGKCSHCGEIIVSHRACPKCGYYHGIPVVKTKQKKTKKEK